MLVETLGRFRASEEYGVTLVYRAQWRVWFQLISGVDCSTQVGLFLSCAQFLLHAELTTIK